MGLTIHYTLKSKAETVAEAFAQVVLLRKKMLELPFQEVCEIEKFKELSWRR